MSDPFDFDAPPARFAVMGNPVKHSKSPQIHAAFGAQTGISLEYTAIQVDPGGFQQAVDNFRANGGRGLNITVPYKVEAFHYADRCHSRASQAGAVNTLIFDADAVIGDNTDGTGLVTDITRNLGIPIEDQSVLLVGAGGAARGVLATIQAAAPSRIVLANRTVDKARLLAEQFRAGVEVTGCGFDDLAGERFDIIINATSASLTGDVPPLPVEIVTPRTLVYDMMYSAEQTAFNAWASRLGARQTADGVGMLVEQAAEAFLLWHGVRPQTAAVINSLRDRSFLNA